MVSYDNLNQPVFSSGIMSCVNRRIRGWERLPYLKRLLEIQAFADPGFSGGPVVTVEGKLVGIITLKVETNDRWRGYCLAIPIETVRDFISESGTQVELVHPR